MKFSRNRQSSDQMNDYSFTNTVCYYFLYPVEGGSYNSDGTINKHTRTPSISDDVVCIRNAGTFCRSCHAWSFKLYEILKLLIWHNISLLEDFLHMHGERSLQMLSFFDQLIEVGITFKQYNYRFYLRHKYYDLNIIDLWSLYHV